MQSTDIKPENTKVKTYGVIVGILLLIIQHCFYLLANYVAGKIGNEPFSPKIPAIDDAFKIVPIFIIPYVWAYAFWTMAPMAVSKCGKRHFCDVMAAWTLAILMGDSILAVAPTYMDRVAEGLMDPSMTGPLNALRRFWYSIDGGDMAFNLMPSVHCINSTVAYLGVAGRREIPKWFRVYSLITAILIYFATMFVKQHFFLDVVTGIAVGAVSYAIAVKCHAGRIFTIFHR